MWFPVNAGNATSYVICVRCLRYRALVCYVIALFLTAFRAARCPAIDACCEEVRGSLHCSKAYAALLQQLSSAIINEASVSKNASAIKTGFQRLAALNLKLNAVVEAQLQL